MNTIKNNQTAAEEQVLLLSSELEDIKLKFIQSDKLAFIGRLTAGIMHEIKNPLNFINNFAKVSQELVEELNELMDGVSGQMDKETLTELEGTQSMLKANISKILENGERAQRIVFSMLAQMRDSQEIVFAPYDVNKLVDEFAKLSYQGIRGNDKEFNVTFKTDYDPTIGWINLGFQEVSRVIVNFVNNACYALNEKKKMMQASFSPEILLATKKDENFVEIIIRDNGIGISPLVLNKLFTPFFTTKPKGQGTGLGLSLSYDIITNIHKGKIEVSSIENEYTEFKIFIPLNLS